MGKKPSKHGIAGLTALMGAQGSAPPQQEPEEARELTDQEVEDKVANIMAVVQDEGEEDYFLMQDLIEHCAGLLRSNIREEFYTDPEEET